MSPRAQPTSMPQADFPIRLRDKLPARSLAKGFLRGLWRGLYVGLHDQLAWASWAVANRLGTRPPDYGDIAHDKVGALRYSQRNLMKFTPLARTEWLMYLAAALRDSAPGGPTDHRPAV